MSLPARPSVARNVATSVARADSLTRALVAYSRQRLDKSVSLQVSDQLDRSRRDFQELEEKYRCVALSQACKSYVPFCRDRCASGIVRI